MYRKLIRSFVISSLATLSIVGLVSAAPLWQIPFNQRAQMAQDNGIVSSLAQYKGSLSQNLALLKFLNNEPSKGLLGAGYTPVTGYRSRTTQYVSATATTIPVAGTKDQAGNAISTANISSSSTVYIYLNLDAGNTGYEEPIACTGITSTSFTGCIRGLPFQGSSLTTSSTIARAHNAGTPIIITNIGQFHNEFVSADGTSNIYGVKTFYSLPVASTITTSPTTADQLATKYYVDTVGAGGFTSLNVGVGLAAMGSSPEKVRIAFTSTSTQSLGFTGNFPRVELGADNSLARLNDGLSVSTSTNYIWSGNNIWSSTSNTFSGDLHISRIFTSSTLVTATHTSSTIPLLAVGYIGSTSTNATTTIVNDLLISGNVRYTGNSYNALLSRSGTFTEDANGTTSDIPLDYTDLPYTPSLFTLTCAADNVTVMTWGTATAVGAQQSLNNKGAFSAVRQSTTQILDDNYGGTSDLQWKIFQMSATSTLIKRVEVPTATSVISCQWSIQ